MSIQSSQNPQNPYASFVVRASAGAGKTYQLSQRFLRLVSAGADPAEILTVTFTRKAAAEMQERIFEDAIILLADQAAAAEFDAGMQAFYRDGPSADHGLRAPRSAAETAQAILAFSQSLKIQTMDSLFQEWVTRFPVEAGSHIPLPFRIGSTHEMGQLRDHAWLALFESADLQRDNLPEKFQHYFSWPGRSSANLRQQLEGLQNEALFLWRLMQGEEQAALRPLPTLDAFIDFDDDDLLQGFAELVQRAGERVGLKTGIKITDAAAELRATGDPACLRGALWKKTGDWEFPVAVAKKLSDDDPERFRNYLYETQVRRLNLYAKTLSELFASYSAQWQLHKIDQNLVEYDDVTRGAYNLFHSPDSFGVRYHMFLRISHLLVDEFQDTSRVQWDIFSSIAEELLAGEGLAREKGILPTVFIVGDAKQSIYGFRQGDFRLLDEANIILTRQYGAQAVSLNHSWRSSQLVLDAVNQVFSAPEWQRLLSGFGEHRTAEINDTAVVPPTGSFTVLEPFRHPEINRNQEHQTLEAETLCRIIAGWINNQLPVYDKALGQHRPVAFRDIGILYRKMDRSSILEQMFIREAIPYLREERRGYFRRREIEDVVALLEFLAHPGDDVAVATLLRSPMLRMSDAELMQVLQYWQEKAQGKTLFNLLQTVAETPYRSLRVALDRLGRHSVEHIVLHFLEFTKARAAYQMAFGEKEGKLASANLEQIIQILGTQQPPGSGTVRDYLTLLRQFSGVDETGNAQLSANSVKMMTIHKAKGLEFPVVILLGAEAGLGRSQSQSRTGLRKLPDDGIYYIGRNQDERPPMMAGLADIEHKSEMQEKQENMRLLYVALTRAQEHILVSSCGAPGAESYHNIIQNTVFRDLDAKHLRQFDCKGWFIAKPGVAKTGLELPETMPDIAIPDSFGRLPQTGLRLDRPSDADKEALETRSDEAEKISAAEIESSMRAREYARLTGTLVHDGLAAHFQKADWNLAGALESVMLEALFRFSDKERASIASQVQAHIRTTLASVELKKMLQTALAPPRVEVPVLHRTGNNLVSGVVDLLLESSDNIWIIDFKTVAMRSAEPATICREKRYTQQLQKYAAAVAAIFPGKKVNAAVLFTESGTLFELS